MLWNGKYKIILKICIALIFFISGFAHSEPFKPKLAPWLKSVNKNEQAKKLLTEFPKKWMGLRLDDGKPELVAFAAAAEPVPLGHALKFLDSQSIEVSVIVNADFSTSENESRVKKAFDELKQSIDFQGMILFTKNNPDKVSIEIGTKKGSSITLEAQAPNITWNREELTNWIYKSLGYDGYILDRKGVYILLAGNEFTLKEGFFGAMLSKKDNIAGAFGKVISAKAGYAIVKLYPNNSKVVIAPGNIFKVSEE